MTVLSEVIRFIEELPWNGAILAINALACAVSATMLGTYQRKGNKHRIAGGLMALALVVACGSVVIQTATGGYEHSNLAETVINVMLCISLIKSHGNVMKIFGRDKKE